jgi:nicotinamide mononucleotide transporter
MVAALNRPAFGLWGVPVSWAEVLGDLSGGLCVWLVARQHVLNWRSASPATSSGACCS